MKKLKSYWAYSLIGIFLILIIAFLILIFEIYRYAGIDETQKADAIVVLGAAQWDREPSPIFKARLDHALSLHQKNYAPMIILTGGVSKAEIVSESQIGEDYLVSKGIREDVIFLEKEGHTTLQSLKQVKDILEAQDLDSIVLVSHGFHLMRAKKMCEDLGISAFASPVIAKNKISELKYVLREAVVYILYLLFKI